MKSRLCNHCRLALGLVSAILLSLAGPARADFVGLNSTAATTTAQGATLLQTGTGASSSDALIYKSQGTPSFTQPAAGFSTTSQGATGTATTTMASPANSPSGFSVDSIGGSFSDSTLGNGDSLLYNSIDNYASGPGGGSISVLFTQAIGGAGARIEPGFAGGYTARIQGLDVSGNVIVAADFSVSSSASYNGSVQDTAPFLGLYETNITIPTLFGVRFSFTAGDSGTTQQFGISDVAFVPPVLLSTIPEPSSLVLGGLGVASLLGYSWRRRRTNKQV